MIYLYNGCTNICHLPALCCEKCGEVCEPCAQAFKNCGEFFNGLLNRPLGGFVLMAVWISILELGCSVYSLMKEDEYKDCHFQDPQFGFGIHNWLEVQMGFAALNLLFAPYVQWQLWRRLNEEARLPDDPDLPPDCRTQEANTATGAIRASKQDVVEAFKHVFLYDFGVLVYFIVLCTSFGFSYYGSHKIHQEKEDCHDKTDGLALYSAYTGMFFVVFVALYGIAWYFSIYCLEHSDTLTLRRGLTLAADVAAATGRPVPGFAPSKVATNAANKPGGLSGAGFAGVLAGHAVAHAAGNAPGRTNQAMYAQAPGRSGTRYNNLNNMPPCDPAQAQLSPPTCMSSFGKLLASIGIDALGNATYVVPGVGEYGDAVFAPASAVMLKMMYNANGIALINLAEELCPFTDIIPTATIAWFLQHCAPNSPISRAVGINNTWELTGGPQR